MSAVCGSVCEGLRGEGPIDTADKLTLYMSSRHFYRISLIAYRASPIRVIFK